MEKYKFSLSHTIFWGTGIHRIHYGKTMDYAVQWVEVSI
jgi:hypothetical protein